jgi:hypothetical protein
MQKHRAPEMRILYDIMKGKSGARRLKLKSTFSFSGCFALNAENAKAVLCWEIRFGSPPRRHNASNKFRSTTRGLRLSQWCVVLSRMTRMSKRDRHATWLVEIEPNPNIKHNTSRSAPLVNLNRTCALISIHIKG